MTAVGMIVRADMGGLAAMTLDAWRHVRPARTLVVDLGDNARGGVTRSWLYDADWTETTVTGPRFGVDVDTWFDGLDVVWTAETWYDERVPSIARSYGCRTVVHAMPELYRPAGEDVVWWPTEWLARGPVVPVPVPTDQIRYRPRDECRVLFHVTGEAMADRNGTDALLAAVADLTHPTRLLIRGRPHRAGDHEMIGRCHVVWLGDVAWHYETIPDNADVVVLPRRYGGLCLPAAEACAAGLPVVMPDLVPNGLWSHRRPGARPGPVLTMKGGPVQTWDVVRSELVAILDAYADTPHRVREDSDRGRAWAEANSWDALGAAWVGHLDDAAATP